MQLICQWGFESLGLERIDLLAASANGASQRVADRAGFTREGLLRSYMAGKEGRQDMVAFGLLSSDAGLRRRLALANSGSSRRPAKSSSSRAQAAASGRASIAVLSALSASSRRPSTDSRQARL